nr:uncharacterized protein LOC113827913 [Penaeus vannamei]
MASAKARTSFLLLLLHIFPAAPFEILRDCIVSSQITESNILFDTLEFLALVPDGRTGIRARISCADDQYHYIEWNSQRITATTTSTFGPYGAPDSSNGWTRFTLGYVGHLTLFDGRRQSWLPGNISFQCPVSNVELSGSFFTRMCPTSTPVWKVEGKGSVDIPLHVDDETPENLTLFSTTNFRPVFRVDDSEFHLGMSGESLMTGRHHEPLFGGPSPCPEDIQGKRQYDVPGVECWSSHTHGESERSPKENACSESGRPQICSGTEPGIKMAMVHKRGKKSS